jgi:hypothetical protein
VNDLGRVLITGTSHCDLSSVSYRQLVSWIVCLNHHSCTQKNTFVIIFHLHFVGLCLDKHASADGHSSLPSICTVSLII